MKIWQRTFIVTMFIVTVFTLVMGLLLIENQYKYQLDGEVRNTKQFHEKVLSAVNVEVQKKMQETKKGFLDDEEFLEAYENAFEQFTDMNYGIKLSADSQDELYNYYFDNESINSENIQYSKQAKYEIVHKSDYYFLVMASGNSVYGREIKCLTEVDITSVYTAYHAQLERLKVLSIILSLMSAIILLAVIKWLLNPLMKLQQGIHDIADGAYGRQLEIKGKTEISELTSDINQMSIKIGQNNQAKEEMIADREIFIGNMAHEMKTPLTAILGFSDILTIHQNLTQEQMKEYSGYIYKEAVRLKAMSGKLMELTQIGEDNVKSEIVDIGNLLAEVIEAERIIFKAGGITIDENIEPAMVNVDKDLLKSVFYNVLDNAGKVTSAGGHIEIYIKKDCDNVTVEVRDFGIGIPKEEIEKVLEPFYMVDKSRTRKHGGAGLGLALCKKIITVSGGQIRIESDTGKGCSVFVTLPIVHE